MNDEQWARLRPLLPPPSQGRGRPRRDDRLIVDGISLHSVIGRRIFETWHITRYLLESRDPNIHDLIFEVILNHGQGTTFDFKDYDPTAFQKAISTYPKVIIRY